MHIETAEIFSDTFARRRNPVTAIEPRTKLVFTVAVLAINLLSAGLIAPLCIAGFCLAALLSIRMPLKTLMLRLAMPLFMAAVIMVAQVFLNGGTPLFSIPFWGFSLTGYYEGLARGLLILCRVIGGVLAVLLLSMSTPADELFRAAGWFRVPRTLVELSLLIYRYVFVLAEEFVTMKEAQKVRLGYHSWKQSMKSLSTLGASLVLRAYDRAERVFEAMLVRGYTGGNAASLQAFNKKDGLAALGLAGVLIMFYLVGRVG